MWRREGRFRNAKEGNAGHRKGSAVVELDEATLKRVALVVPRKEVSPRDLPPLAALSPGHSEASLKSPEIERPANVAAAREAAQAAIDPDAWADS